MSVRQQQRLRRERERREFRRLIIRTIGCLLSAIPAILLAFQFGLVGKIRQQFRGANREAAQLAERPPDESPESLPANPTPEESRFKSGTAAPSITRPTIPRRGFVDSAPDLRQSENEQPASPPRNLGDLLKNGSHQEGTVLEVGLQSARAITFLDSSYSKCTFCKVVAVDKSPAEYEIKPPSGQFSASKPARIVFRTEPAVAIQVSLKTRTKDSMRHRVIELSTLVEGNNGEPLPLSFQTIADEQARNKRAGSRLAGSLDAALTEQRELELWLKAPRVKSLEARGRAKTRLIYLDAEIVGLQADLAAEEGKQKTLANLSTFAQAMHDTTSVRVAAGPAGE